VLSEGTIGYAATIVNAQNQLAPELREKA